MKKVLSTVAALGLVAGLASTASAVEFSMSGNYVAEGIYQDKAVGKETLSTADKADIITEFGLGALGITTGMIPTDVGGVNLNDSDASSDAWYQHTFELKPTMKVNDKISMFATIRLADNTIWGNQDGGDTAGDGIGDANGDVYVHHLYMDYASPMGKIRVGRTPAGPYGTSFADTDSRQDRIMLWPSFLKSGGWSTLFYVAKVKEVDAYEYEGSSSDNDHYEARLYYKNENLDSGIRYGFTNNNAVVSQEDEKQSVSVYGKYKRENLFFNGELTRNFGDKNATDEYDSWGAMLQLGAKMDALTPSLTYFYASGDNDLTGDAENFGTTGTEFTPLYILTGRQTGLLNQDQAGGVYSMLMNQTGVHAVVAAVDFAASDRLTLHGAIGWAQADDEFNGQDDEYGWEYNVGAAYKLLDNLTYEAHFGYLDTGDYFKFGDALDTENVYVLTHHLTMTF